MALATRTLEPGDKVRVLVVDDSVVVRRTVTIALSADPEIDVIGVAASGRIALQKVDQLNPDLVTLDVEMPDMNGLDTLSELRRRRPDLRVIMLSSLTERGAATTIEALSLGADDCIPKTSGSNSIDQSIAILREQLSRKIKQFFRFRPAAVPVSAPVQSPLQRRRQPNGPVEAVAIGISTGGPAALAEILPLLPSNYPLPLLIVQHMPPMFTKLLAQRLNSLSRIRVVEAEAGMAIESGTAYIAPGDHHMRVVAGSGLLEIATDQGPPENCCRPAVDVLFRSAAEVYKGSAAALIMTGMGQDGLAGARALWAAGSNVLVQDEKSSVVWGMPGAVATAGLADTVVPLREIAPALMTLAKRTKS